MDISRLKTLIGNAVQKYKFVFLILCIGVVLILWPSKTVKKSNEAAPIQSQIEPHISQDLSADREFSTVPV